MPNSLIFRDQTVDILIRSTGRPQLYKALASLAEQTFDRLRVLVADAAALNLQISPTPPLEIEVVSTGQKMSRSEAANALLSRSTADLAMFLDDDDWVLPDHVEKLVAQLCKHPEAVLAYTDTRCVRLDATGREIILREFKGSHEPERLMLDNHIPIHSALFRRNAATRPLRFDAALDLYEDWDFWLQLQQKGPFVHVPGFSAFYLIHENSGTGVWYPSEDKAIKTLQYMLDKWRQQWTIEQLRNLWGYARQVGVLRLENANLQSLMADLQAEIKVEHHKVRDIYEAEIIRLDSLRRHQIDQLAQSLSWRLTRPLRALGRFLYRLLGR